jgi:hypothetical protein
VKPEWKIVATRDVKYVPMTLTELMSWIKENVPEGTKEEDIRIEVAVDQYKEYYDDIIIEAIMELSVRNL